MANVSTYTSRENGSLWIIPDGPNTKPQYLPCHDLEDISESRGSISLIQCVNDRGEFETIGVTQSPPEPTTTTLGTYIGKVADWIETVSCPFGLYVLLRSSGKASVFENWERGMLIQVQKVTNVTRSGLVRISEDAAAMHTFDVEALPGVIDFFRFTSVEQSIDAAVAGAVTSVRYLDDPACWDSAGSTKSACDTGYAVTTADTGVTAEVLASPTDTVAAWTPTAADPFAADEDIADVALFKVGRNTNRILVVRGTTDGANPMEVAYSDDSGATWTTANVGSTNGEYAIKKGALFAGDKYNIYLVSDGGRIYKSEDGGESWSVKEDANITSSQYNAVHFVNPSVGYAVGTAGLVVRTLDGGKTWGQVAASAGAGELFSVFVLSEDRVWVGSASGVMYYTNDGGSSWTAKTLPGAAQNVNEIVFENDYKGYVANGTSIKFTITGGYSWDIVEDTANLFSANMVSINVCSSRLVYGASSAEIIQSGA